MTTKILLVDDHQEFRTTVKDYILRQDLDVEVFEASSGEMAVGKSSFIHPDIILMDIHLPQANGITATKYIKEDYPDCDVIILTMFEVESFKRVAKNIAARDFIGKSEIYDRLVPILKKCIEERKVVNRIKHVKNGCSR